MKDLSLVGERRHDTCCVRGARVGMRMAGTARRHGAASWFGLAADAVKPAMHDGEHDGEHDDAGMGKPMKPIVETNQ